MQTSSFAPEAATMTLEVTSMSVASRIKSVLKLIDGVKSVKIKKVPSELQLSLEEARKGNVVQFDNVNDVMNFLHS